MFLSQSNTAFPQNKSDAKNSKLGTSSNLQSKSSWKRIGFRLLGKPNCHFLGKLSQFRCFLQVSLHCPILKCHQLTSET